MNLFRMPLLATYHLPNCSLVAPDGTFIYVSVSQIVCIKHENGEMNTFSLECPGKILGIDCDPDFDRTKFLVCSCEDKNVYVWDLEKKAAIFGHTGHVEKTQQKERDNNMDPLPLTFTLNKKIVSASKSRLIVYCVASNTYKMNIDITRKNQFTVLKASPYDPNSIAGGTRAGLIVLISLKDMSITHTMRAHDTEIRSLDWMKVKETPVEEEDLFDIYTCNDTDNDFGVIRDRRADETFDLDTSHDDNNKDMHEAMENMKEEGFDFTEACQALKHDILATLNDNNTEEKKVFDFKELVENQKCENKAHTDSFSASSEAPSRDNDFKSVENHTANANKEEKIMDNDLVLLISTAAEPQIWIWDALKGRALDKIQLFGINSKQNVKVNNLFAAKWLNPYNIITNDQNGNLCLWDIEYREEGKISLHKSKQEFMAKAVVQISVNHTTEHFWSLSLYPHIAFHNPNTPSPILEYTTMTSKIYCFVVNPVDPNVIAIAGLKRVSLLNVSKMSHDHCTMNYMNNQLHSMVLTLAWHPEKENVLAFGTREGRIGIFDTTRMHNSPTIMKPFFSKDVYSVTWAKFKAKKSDEASWTLFCCGMTGNAGYLVYYPQQGSTKFVATEVKNFKNVTAVKASDEYLAVGLFGGTVHIIPLTNDTLTPTYTYECGPKLISAFSFFKDKLAVACFNNDITILTLNSNTDVKVQTLKGHTSHVTCVNWSLSQSDLLVSTGSDRTVRIWDTKEEKSEVVATLETGTFAAIFHPKNNDIVFVGGNSFMVTMLNYKEKKLDCKKGMKTGEKLQGLSMATANDVDVVAKAKKEKRKNLEIQKRLEKTVDVEIKTENETQDVINGIQTLKLDEEQDLETTKEVEKEPDSSKSVKEKREKAIQLNYSSIFFLTPRELNRDPIGLLKALISPESSTNNIRHLQLLSSDQNTVRALLNEEHTHQIASSAQSVGHLTLPMLTMDIKSVIIEKISSKTLTEEYIAVAPFISYTFWRNTCLAYAHQCVEQGLILKAISYFLCCNEVNDAISVLVQSNHFTEAMAVAKMRKSVEDPIFMEIVEKWTSYLEYCGNFEAAAIVWIAYGNKSSALKVLERRNNPSEELQEVIASLKNGNSDGLSEH